MKTILVVEIKDNKTIATLTKHINGEHNLLLHETYGSKPLTAAVAYDLSIIERIREDLLRMDMLTSIDEAYLTINTRRTVTTSMPIEFEYNADVNYKRKALKAKLEKQHPKFAVAELLFSNTDNQLTKREVSATVEFVEREYFEFVKGQFNNRGIEFTKYVPVIRSIANSTKEDAIRGGVTLSVLIEEKFTQLTTMRNGEVISSTRWKEGLTDIYEYIAESMGVSKPAAKKFFKSFGSIPPEDVIDDKVIHSSKNGKELSVFTKKDLSRFITERVNELFSNVKSSIDPYRNNNEEVRIVFNGEITSLIGFRKYASKSFGEEIRRFTSHMIGLADETEFITAGILKETKQFNTPEVKEEINTSRINIFNKIIRMYNYI